ncbi:MAG: PD40 domain-containing protein [Planctomycetes bacterium]|nr:PD40 domain-containing protein [Planctomycetota bacterium]
MKNNIAHRAVTRTLVAFALALVFVAAAGTARGDITDRVSVASDGTQGNDVSNMPAISADGRFVAFQSYASSLVEDDTNGSPDVFVHDRQTGTTTRVSVASDGTQGNGDSYWPSISGDGRFVTFGSDATNLVEGDTNGYSDVFVRDRNAALTVKSMPFGGVSITGDKPGATDYEAMCFDGDTVNLTAPESVTANGRTWYFQYWLVDGDPTIPTPFLSGRPDPNVQLLMDADRTLMAVYDWRPQGDVTGDCFVNVLDLLYVRNRLQTTCSE